MTSLPSLNRAPDSTTIAGPDGIDTGARRYRNDPYRQSVVRPPPAVAKPLRADRTASGLPAIIPQPPPTLPPTHSGPNPRANAPAFSAANATPPTSARPPRAASFRSGNAPAALTSTAGAECPIEGADYDAIALVRYKRTSSAAVYHKADFPNLAIGDVVVVTGDRGEHCATVAKLSLKKVRSTPAYVLRSADREDLAAMDVLRRDEAAALADCHSHVRRLGLDANMEVVDVEFQMDRQKLTIFFQPKVSGAFVDFRLLQRVLYHHFRCRIWIVDCPA